MSTTDKQLNVDLLERLKIVETALDLAQEEHAEKTVAYLELEKKWLERMLYQDPGKND